MTAWTDWEDWEAGLYQPGFSEVNVADSLRLLSDLDYFLEVAREMVRAWPHAATHNLKHMWTGRNAWIGQASCLYAHASPAAATRQAWGLLTPQQQTAANRVAVHVRTEWEDPHGSQTLLGL